MSLIERAVARLAEGASKSPGEVEAAGGGDRAAVPRKTAIEALADRLADASVRPPAAAPSRASAAGVQAPAPLTGSAPAPQTGAPSARQATGAPEQVRIHLEAMRARGMVVPNSPSTPASQEFRVIKRPLLANALGRSGQEPVPNGKRIMVTSAFPGEGKSFCAINLAMSIASERDHGVILVDADVARPGIPRELGISAGAGLMDWLIDGRPDLSQLVLETNVDKLSILPAGRHHQDATELLASDAMSRLLEQLSERYSDRIIVFDSPPLLVTTEARVLASYMGQIVMVVEAGRTPREAVSQALATLESNEIVGLVLNKAHNVETSGYYRGYGYGSA